MIISPMILIYDSATAFCDFPCLISLMISSFFHDVLFPLQSHWFCAAASVDGGAHGDIGGPDNGGLTIHRQT